MSTKEIILVSDPMCSWSWGFAPVVTQLQEHFSDTYKISVVMGGLRTKGQMPWDEESRAFLKQTWQEVAYKTGQPFQESLLQKEHFEYDTYPASKAVVTVREILGDEAALRYLYTLQEAFYKDGIDITKPRLLFGYYERLFGNSSKFAFMYATERIETLFEHDRAKARSMGATAFPSVVLIDESGHMVCKKGYCTFDELKLFLKETDA